MTNKARHGTRGKPKLSFVVGGGAALAAIVLILLFTVFSSREKPSETLRPDDRRSGAPPFRKDGIVQILSPDGVLLTTVTAEFAEREEERVRGLMGRMQMAENEGMFFIFEEEEPRAFWMVNTQLPLDIIFIDGKGIIVKIHTRTTPFSSQSLESGKPARYVLEVNGGFCERHGVQEGCRVVSTRNGRFQ
ncbi:MAG: DUF192 domain-containing protein [Bacteroidota bacterium]|nr:DUF192 domain-containing protein [Bacteroidota bacterium]